MDAFALAPKRAAVCYVPVSRVSRSGRRSTMSAAAGATSGVSRASEGVRAVIVLEDHAVAPPANRAIVIGEILCYVPLVFRESLERSQQQILERRHLYPLLSKLHWPPPYHALNLLKVAWSLLGYRSQDLGGVVGGKAFDWHVARHTFTPAFVTKLLAFSPSAEDYVREEAKPASDRLEALKRTLDTMLEREVLEQGPTFTPLLRWAQACVSIRATCLEQRERARILLAEGL